jgi:hypothetical protein
MTTTPSPTPTSRYALQAERKMGEMLAQTERANVARDRKKAELHDVTPPTLAALGLSKRESAAAQELAAYPQDRFEALLALTAADWARRKGLGEEAIAHARRYALQTERGGRRGD